jgi:hypothetical protein
MGHLQGFLNAAWMPNPLSQFNRVQMKIAKVNKGLLYVRLPCLSRVICGFFSAKEIYNRKPAAVQGKDSWQKWGRSRQRPFLNW